MKKYILYEVMHPTVKQKAYYAPFNNMNKKLSANTYKSTIDELYQMAYHDINTFRRG